MSYEHRPQELRDWQLLAYLDGEADTEVSVHIEHCADCRRRARDLAGLQDRLTATLYRHACPSSTEIGEYHLGLLSSEQAGAVSRHLEDCPHCTRELAELGVYLSDLAPDIEASPLERMRRLVAELVRSGQGLTQLPALAPAPAFAGLRGGETEPQVYQVDEFQIAIELQQDSARQGRYVLLGLVMGAESPADLEATLWRADELLKTVRVDELGNLVMSGLAAGQYDLFLRGQEVEIQVQGLAVGGAQQT